MEDPVTTAEAARIIGCVDSRVRQLLRDGKLSGKRVGRDWLIERKSAEAYRDSERRPGPKTDTPDAAKRKTAKKPTTRKRRKSQ